MAKRHSIFTCSIFGYREWTALDCVGGFASESFSVPMLQIGTIVWVMGYLLWVQPLIAAFAIVNHGPVTRRTHQLDLQIADERVSDADTGTDPSRKSGLIEYELARDAGWIVVGDRDSRRDFESHDLAHNFRSDTESDHVAGRADL